MRRMDLVIFSAGGVLAFPPLQKPLFGPKNGRFWETDLEVAKRTE